MREAQGPFLSKSEGKKALRDDGEILSLPETPVQGPALSPSNLNEANKDPISGATDIPERSLHPNASKLLNDSRYIAPEEIRQTAQHPPDPVSRWSSSSDDSEESKNWRKRISETMKSLGKRKDSTQKFLRRSSAKAEQLLKSEKRGSWRFSFGKSGNGDGDASSTSRRRTISWSGMARRRSKGVEPAPTPPAADGHRDSAATESRSAAFVPFSVGMGPASPGMLNAKSSLLILPFPHSLQEIAASLPLPPSPPRGTMTTAPNNAEEAVLRPQDDEPISPTTTHETPPSERNEQADADAEYLRRRLQATEEFRGEQGGIMSPQGGGSPVLEGSDGDVDVVGVGERARRKRRGVLWDSDEQEQDGSGGAGDGGWI
ncbi:hypothetical protein M409DRAFT_28405 [Zasmidium cellare ATCC 36951]|uniref:Uncharacterized protein n=1 Tax=Zasmidium cellare ATCC 36951 TaxID=1080233 RepID=A0A6A6C265_ZASCE|nr:uncharacterized protein M409DRAFT_28405 [Zasmidium cellare ATCC 36951]KAF2161075.1 hypothetical protein M409DRAFT_28405 [Zasmidium cellare ATCC 36951]